MERHGWVVLFHICIVEQLQKLSAAVERAQRNDPEALKATLTSSCSGR
jgi:toxin YhaV